MALPRLEGRVATVTGAGLPGNIGQAVCAAFLGTKLCAAAISERAVARGGTGAITSITTTMAPDRWPTGVSLTAGLARASNERRRADRFA